MALVDLCSGIVSCCGEGIGTVKWGVNVMFPKVVCMVKGVNVVSTPNCRPLFLVSGMFEL